ncbi:MAG: sulfatase-like hydrolase/transferase [Verrucomicrobia bacterium]|nr:MAG: sulfatase-like hydrolase/transferase [Verrucomicrobiota bacterium]
MVVPGSSPGHGISGNTCRGPMAPGAPIEARGQCRHRGVRFQWCLAGGRPLRRNDPMNSPRIRLLLFLVVVLTTGNLLRAAPPNILVIVSDDQAWTDYGFMGHREIRTPHLDRLASESRRFTRGYVPSSLCCPSLASLITGRYPHQHGITGNDPPLPSGPSGGAKYQSPEFVAGRQRLNARMDESPALPRLLAGAGYRSFQSGKWWQGNFRHGGFTHGMTRGEDAGGGRHGDDGLRIGRETLQPIGDFIDSAQKDGLPWFVVCPDAAARTPQPAGAVSGPASGLGAVPPRGPIPRDGGMVRRNLRAVAGGSRPPRGGIEHPRGLRDGQWVDPVAGSPGIRAAVQAVAL